MDRGFSVVGAAGAEGTSYFGKVGTDSFLWISDAFFRSVGSGLYTTDVADEDFCRCVVVSFDSDGGRLTEADGCWTRSLFSCVSEIGLGTVGVTAVLRLEAVEVRWVGERDEDSLCTS